MAEKKWLWSLEIVANWKKKIKQNNMLSSVPSGDQDRCLCCKSQMLVVNCLFNSIHWI